MTYDLFIAINFIYALRFHKNLNLLFLNESIHTTMMHIVKIYRIWRIS